MDLIISNDLLHTNTKTKTAGYSINFTLDLQNLEFMSYIDKCIFQVYNSIDAWNKNEKHYSELIYANFIKYTFKLTEQLLHKWVKKDPRRKVN